jgi:hypothetical protein
MAELIKAFSEDEAKKILEKYLEDNHYKANRILIENLWSYTESPFYSAHAWVQKNGREWGDTYRFHIHANGEVSMFREEKTEEEEDPADYGC